MAASNDRIVSKGRSNRGRVGLERSGSVIMFPYWSLCCIALRLPRFDFSRATKFGCASFIASIGSALVCKLRLCFSSEVSVREILWPEPLERWVFSDLSDLPLELKPRLRLEGVGDVGWGETIFMTKTNP